MDMYWLAVMILKSTQLTTVEQTSVPTDLLTNFILSRHTSRKPRCSKIPPYTMAIMPREQV